jgi:SAM-dependent methyltransferase
MSQADAPPSPEQIASQLARPHDELGVQVAEHMARHNAAMTLAGIEALALRDGLTIVELGHAQAQHLDDLLSRADALMYIGLECSTLMYEEATRRHRERMMRGEASFGLYGGERLPLPSRSIDRFLTVNTLYFWSDPQGIAAELRRALCDGGEAVIVFSTRSFMSTLPFTQHGFTLYEPEEVEALLCEAGFAQVVMSEHEDLVPRGVDDAPIRRPFWIARAIR